jgi:hypothetical protein
MAVFPGMHPVANIAFRNPAGIAGNPVGVRICGIYKIETVGFKPVEPNTFPPKASGATARSDLPRILFSIIIFL